MSNLDTWYDGMPSTLTSSSSWAAIESLVADCDDVFGLLRDEPADSLCNDQPITSPSASNHATSSTSSPSLGWTDDMVADSPLQDQPEGLVTFALPASFLSTDASHTKKRKVEEASLEQAQAQPVLFAVIPDGSFVAPANSDVDEKRLRRKLQNRQSARNSRNRKRERVAELEQQIDRLEEEKKRLQGEVSSLREANKKLSLLSSACDGCCAERRISIEASTGSPLAAWRSDTPLRPVPQSDAGKAVCILALVFFVGLAVHHPAGANVPHSALSTAPSATSYHLPRPTGRVLLSVPPERQMADLPPSDAGPKLERKQIFLVVLLEHFCRALSTDAAAARSMFLVLCQKLQELRIVQSNNFVDQMDSVHSIFREEFNYKPDAKPPVSSRPKLPKLLESQVAQAEEKAALAMRPEPTDKTRRGPVIICPDAKLAHGGAASTEQNELSLLLPEKSVAGAMNFSGASSARGMYEVRCGVSEIHKWRQPSDHLHNAHQSMEAIHRLIAAPSPAAQAA
jgi:polyhydroxyalkanoate synthesis regulator phasin